MCRAEAAADYQTAPRSAAMTDSISESGLWAQAFLHNALGIAVADAQTRTLLTVNAAYAQLVGSTPEELKGQPFLAVYPVTEHEPMLAAAEAADLTGTATLQTCRLHRDGSLIPVALRIVSLHDASGRVTHRVATVTDLRPQLRAEGQLLHAEVHRTTLERFRQLADSAPIGILLMDADGACDYANPHWLEITGLAAEQAQEDGWWSAVHADDRERVNEAWDKLMRGGEVSLEFRYQRTSGEVRWVQSRATALRDDSGDAIGYIAVDVDVTEQLQQRAAIDQFHSRVRALAARLEHLREEERAALARKLHGGLRQEMTTLKAEIDTLRSRRPETASDADGLDQVTELSDRCLQELRHIVFELQPPGVEDLGLAAAMRRHAEECAAQSGLQIAISGTDIPADLGRRRSLALYRSFQEAIANVIRHARAKKIDVQIWMQDGAARLRISDDGIGLGDKDRNKPGCFGLLATSERLAELGGTLRVLGVSGRGTTVDASIPYQPGKRQRDGTKP
jgi:two-component system sensor histidine kinase UhpB